MPPKKRDKELDGQKAPRMDQIQADHELFLQAFEKPTQIYRFLRTRNQISPIFLYRNLSYMRQRMSRTHKSRRGFRIDTILERLLSKNNDEQTNGVRGYMTLTFLGFYDKKVESSQDPVKVETLLLKICHKKRKDVSSPIMQVSVGTSEVPINPSENQPPPKAPTISIPNESFSLNNGHIAKTYMLLLRVYCTSSNACLIHNCDLDEPAQKRRKSSSGAINKPSGGDEAKLYGSELIVYDKHNRCLLTDGDYELGLQEVQTSVRSSPKKHNSWETIADIKECGPFEVLSRGPTLKFRLCWTSEPSHGLVDRPTLLRPLPSGDNKENRPAELDRCSAAASVNNNNNNNNNNNTSLPNSSPLTPSKMSVPVDPKIETTGGVTTTAGPTQQIVYQFLYNNNSRQQTEACEDLHCPWCSLDCGKLYSLLKHLKLCHSRFTFTYVPIPQGARIDVAINECYDGSYAGSPHELISQPSGVAFSRSGPTRRTSVTNILVCRPKRTRPSLSEFLELDENEFESQRPYITGHNRLYHHTVTCLPIYPKELDIDSEGENDPRWLQTKTMMMIDDFTDVNEGEKELMKMWNLHVMKYGYVGDCQIPLACQMFLETRGKELLMKNLYRNFVLHMSSLFDFGLVSPVVLYQTIQKLQEMMKEGGEESDVRRVLRKSHEAQVERWITSGLHASLNGNKINSAKTNFNETTSHANARRKMPLGSPPSHNNSQNTKNSIHNSSVSSKHASMIIGVNNKMSVVVVANHGNGKVTCKSSRCPTNAKDAGEEENDDDDDDDATPVRRKSTNSIGGQRNEDNDNNAAPARRKSMNNDNPNEMHRRKLVLDPLPNNNNNNVNNSNNASISSSSANCSNNQKNIQPTNNPH